MQLNTADAVTQNACVDIRNKVDQLLQEQAQDHEYLNAFMRCAESGREQSACWYVFKGKFANDVMLQARMQYLDHLINSYTHSEDWFDCLLGKYTNY